VASGLLALIALMAGCTRRATLTLSALRSSAAPCWRQTSLGCLESRSPHGIHDDDVHRRRMGGVAMAARRPWWGLVAGTAAVLAFFTKAAAAFFIAPIVLDAVWTITRARVAVVRTQFSIDRPSSTEEWAAWLTLAGFSAAAGAVFAFFVWPHWQEFQFYNFQMTVTRKPTYNLRSFIESGVSPATRSGCLLANVAGAVGRISGDGRDRRGRGGPPDPANGFSCCGLLVGLLELVVHDATNARRYVMFVPALGGAGCPPDVGQGARWFPDKLAGRLVAIRVSSPHPCCCWLLYLVFGAALRPCLNTRLRMKTAHSLKAAVRVSTALALLAGVRDTLPGGAAWLDGLPLGASLPPWPSDSRPVSRLRQPADVRALGRAITRSSTTKRRLKSARFSHRHARTGQARERSLSRSRIRSNRSSSAADSATTRTGLNRDDCALYTHDQLAERGPGNSGRSDARDSGAVSEIAASSPPSMSKKRTSFDRAVLVDKNPSAAPAVSGSIVRQISDEQIKAHADRRFDPSTTTHSLSTTGAPRSSRFSSAPASNPGRVLDAGCGGGGMPLSLAEHATEVIGIDPFPRFVDAGVGWPERGLESAALSCGRRMALPFADESFDLVLSHAVIEHVADAPALPPRMPPRAQAGRPFFPVDGPVSVVCRRASCRACGCLCRCICSRPLVAFRTFRFLARHAPWTLKEPAHENSFIRTARQGSPSKTTCWSWSPCRACEARFATRPRARPRRVARHLAQ
jgi:SAM-dependent methyltransferase